MLFLIWARARRASSSSAKVTYQLFCSAYSQWTGLLGQFSLLNISLTELSGVSGSISLSIRIDLLFAGLFDVGTSCCIVIVAFDAVLLLLLLLLIDCCVVADCSGNCDIAN